MEIVKRLRQQRLSSIQNNRPYLYVHRDIFIYFIYKYHGVAQNRELQQFYEQFKRDYDIRIFGVDWLHVIRM